MHNDETRESLAKATAAKFEQLEQTTDPTERARLAGSIERMVKALDSDKQCGHCERMNAHTDTRCVGCYEQL